MSPLPPINHGIKRNNSTRYIIGILLVIGFNLVQIPASLAQQLTNLKTFFNGERVVITYDLDYPDETQHFKVALYSSHDEYEKPLTHVTGNVGYNVSAGKGLRVVWDPLNTLPIGFNDDVTIKIRSTVQLAVNELEQKTYKRGKDLSLKWNGGAPGDKVNVVLMRGTEVYRQLAGGVENSRSYAWEIPKNVKAGKDYSIRVTNANDPAELSMTGRFAIKPQIPIWAKGLVVVGAGAGVYLVATQAGGKEEADLPPITVKPN